MTAQIIGISIDVVLIGIVIFFILKEFKLRTNDNKWPKQFLISMIVGVVAIPAILFNLISASIVLATPVPEIFIPSNEVKITGTHTTGTLKGKTTPNTLVTLKEDVDKDEDPVTKKMYSDNSGKFVFKNLEDDFDYKLSAKNKYHKSKVIKVEVGDIPDSAYTKIHITNEDEFGDTKVDQDANNEAKISGTSAKNARIRLENGNCDTIKTIYADDKGKWNLTLAGPKDKKSKNYTVYAKVHGLLESLGNDITVKNPNYVKPQKAPKKTKDTSTDTTSNDDNQQSSETQSNDSTTNKSKKSTKAPKPSQSEAEQGFTDDMNTYLGNKYPEVSFTYSNNEATFIVPDEVAYLKKNAMKAYVQPMYDRVDLFANANGLKDTPAFIVKTQSGSNIARTSLFGIKVYADK